MKVLITLAILALQYYKNIGIGIAIRFAIGIGNTGCIGITIANIY